MDTNEDHRRGHDTDVRKPCRILLHSVKHTGNARKMAALIIVAFVLFQHFQYKDASCREKTVGSDDDQHHRQEEIGDSAKGDSMVTAR